MTDLTRNSLTVEQVMSPHPEYVPPHCTLREAAHMMRELNVGFLPVSNKQESRLLGVITDRDIVVRAVADGMSMEDTPVTMVVSEGVFYCFASDSVARAVSMMHQHQVYRLVVLNDSEQRLLAGVITLADVVRHGAAELAETAMRSTAA